jgi:hypothetical protein
VLQERLVVQKAVPDFRAPPLPCWASGIRCPLRQERFPLVPDWNETKRIVHVGDGAVCSRRAML